MLYYYSMDIALTKRLAISKTARSNACWFWELSRAFGFDEAREMVAAIQRCGSVDVKALCSLRISTFVLALALAAIAALRALAFVPRIISPPPPAADGVIATLTPKLLPIPRFPRG